MVFAVVICGVHHRSSDVRSQHLFLALSSTCEVALSDGCESRMTDQRIAVSRRTFYISSSRLRMFPCVHMYAQGASLRGRRSTPTTPAQEGKAKQNMSSGPEWTGPWLTGDLKMPRAPPPCSRKTTQDATCMGMYKLEYLGSFLTNKKKITRFVTFQSQRK